MATTGELIRLLNYVDDIAATLRRVSVGEKFITAAEKKRLAEYMREVKPNYLAVIEALEKDAQL
jgi:predicted nucleotidyltransferase